jgi:hypothetical protein
MAKVHTPDPRDGHLGAAGLVHRRAAEQGTALGLEAASSRSHLCPHPGCQARISRRLFACRAHWFQLSRPVRAAIWATVGRQGTRERIDAVKAAMEEWG